MLKTTKMAMVLQTILKINCFVFINLRLYVYSLANQGSNKIRFLYYGSRKQE